MARRPQDDPKVSALRETRSLNPRPEAVSDEAFATSEFLDARDLVQVKYEMVRRVRVEGEPVARAAQAFGFSRPSFYAAQAALDEGGLPALVPQRRARGGRTNSRGRWWRSCASGCRRTRRSERGIWSVCWPSGSGSRFTRVRSSVRWRGRARAATPKGASDETAGAIDQPCALAEHYEALRERALGGQG